MMQTIHNSKGFTILDLIFSIVILSIGFAGLARIFSSALNPSGTAGGTGQPMIVSATNLEQEKLEKIIADKAYSGYSAITSVNYPSEDLTSLGYPGWTRTTTIQYVQSDLTTTSASDVGYKKVTVTVTVPGVATPKTLSTVVSNWP